jgi:hypothetical protein
VRDHDYGMDEQRADSYTVDIAWPTSVLLTIPTHDSGILQGKAESVRDSNV